MQKEAVAGAFPPSCAADAFGGDAITIGCSCAAGARESRKQVGTSRLPFSKNHKID